LFYLQFCLAWFFTAGLFQTAMVIMTHFNWEILDSGYLSPRHGAFSCCG